MKLSLRAYALKKILEIPHTVDRILEYTTDSEATIREVLRELEKKKLLTVYEESKRTYYICDEPKEGDEYTEQEERILNFFFKIRAYYIIAWWFREEGRYYQNDEELKRVVREEYEHARMVQFFDDEFLKKGYELYKKDVPEGRNLSGLFAYTTYARGY
jgi:predicted transcriptional regulator